MDYSNIKKVAHETDPEIVNRYLATERWIILSVGPGQEPDKTAYQLYSLGWYGNYTPSVDTEFPCE